MLGGKEVSGSLEELETNLATVVVTVFVTRIAKKALATKINQ